jgi:hypothetical protein
MVVKLSAGQIKKTGYVAIQVQAFGDTKRRSYIGRLTQWILDYDTPGDPFALAIGKIVSQRVISVPTPLGPIICKTGKFQKQISQFFEHHTIYDKDHIQASVDCLHRNSIPLW